MKVNSLVLIFPLCIMMMTTGDFSHAFGRRRHKESPTKEPKDSQAFPARVISFGQFLKTPFLLPDGKTRVDMSVVLPELVLTELSQSQTKLRARGSSTDPIEGGDRYILKGGVTAFEASTMSGSITIGYKPGVGDIGNGTLPRVESKVSFEVGVLDMDFHIVDTERQEVVAVGKGRAVPVGTRTNVTVDFAAVQTAADFVYKSPMASLFRKAVREAIGQMARDSSTNFLMDWEAHVLRVNLDSNQVLFNSGARDDIAIGNLFTVYDRDDVRLGEVKVQSIEHELSHATFKDDLNQKLLKATRAGDSVKIFYLQK